jgi:hypothetical protein
VTISGVPIAIRHSAGIGATFTFLGSAALDSRDMLFRLVPGRQCGVDRVEYFQVSSDRSDDNFLCLSRDGEGPLQGAQA